MFMLMLSSSELCGIQEKCVKISASRKIFGYVDAPFFLSVANTGFAWKFTF